MFLYPQYRESPLYTHLKLDVVDSTNTYAKQHFEELADGSVVSARVQTAGRGRVGRKWLSSDGLDITASFIFKDLDRPFLAGAITGISAIEMLNEAAPELSPFLKWPNDIYVRDLKLSGMLSEAVWEKGRIRCIICGIGINVNSGSAMLSCAGQPAASLYSLTGRSFDTDFLIERLVKIVNRCYIMCRQYPQEVFEKWRQYNRLIGQQIEVVDPAGKSRTGIFRDVDPDGAMIFEENGVRSLFSCGDVKINAESLKFSNLKSQP